MRFILHQHSKNNRDQTLMMGNIESCITAKESVKPGPLEVPRCEPMSPNSTTRMSSPTVRHRRSPRTKRRSNNSSISNVESEHSTQQPPPPPLSSRSKCNLLRTVKRKSARTVGRASNAIGLFFHALEEFLFPKSLLHEELAKHPTTTTAAVRGGVLLRGCNDASEHYQSIKDVLQRMHGLRGAEALREAGLEYRLVPCDEHKTCSSPLEVEEDDSLETGTDEEMGLAFQRIALQGVPPSVSDLDLLSSDLTSSFRSNATYADISVRIPTPPLTAVEPCRFCHLCTRRLFHIDSNTMIDLDNRKEFVADGDMYERIADLCQEYAHDVMCEEGNMEWVICSTEQPGLEPVRALVNKGHPFVMEGQCKDRTLSSRPTLMVATGRGKVRAGIFSRQHLMCSGLECSTAVPIVREAVLRNLNVIIVDPNVHGERFGFDSFQKTLDYFFESLANAVNGKEEVVPFEARDLYVLSHSASGGHMARYLLDKSDAYLPHIRAIAFTDSTHSIQWAKSSNNLELGNLLESDKCVYFRCSKVQNCDDSQWYLQRAGQQVQTDSFWKHRFGNIKTMWAGTNEHSLTNWYAHAKIWEHFDSFLHHSNAPTLPV